MFDDAGRCVLPCVLEDCGDGNECTVDDCNNLGDGTADVRTRQKRTTRLAPKGKTQGGASRACDLCAKVMCDDENECTIDGACDAATGACPDKIPESAGTPCGDGCFRNGRGTCGACTDNAQCSDDNPCTQDICNSNGECTNPAEPKDTECSDNGGTRCDGAGACVACTDNAHCSDSNPCTSDIGEWLMHPSARQR